MDKTNQRHALIMAFCVLASLFMTVFIVVPVQAASNPVVDGWYMIESGNSSDRVLDINNWSQENGGNLELYQKNNTTNQRFYLKYLNNGYYSIMASHSGKYLHKKDNSSNVHQWDGYENYNAQWALEPAENGYYYLKNRASGKYLDNNGAETNLGNNVGIYDKNKTNAQKWRFVPIDGWFAIESGNSSNRVLDINNWSMDNGGNLEIYQKNITTNQVFYIKNLNNGYYSIMAFHSGKYLHKRGSDDNVHQWDGDSNSNAQWSLEFAGNGYFYLKNRANGKYLDNSGGRTDLGNNVGIYSFNGTNAQKWNFIPVSNVPVSGRKAAIEKARKMTEVRWVAPITFNTWRGSDGELNTVKDFNGNGTKYFSAGRTYIGIPYSMKNRTYDETAFLQKIANVTNRSDIERYYYSNGAGCGFGIDCSAFVCTALNSAGTSLRLNVDDMTTRAMLNDATGTRKYFKTIDYSELRAGDILLKSGHVMLFAGKTPDGKYGMYEANAYYSKCVYTTYSERELKDSGYKACKFNGFND